jgi:hypothetical protein
MSDELTLRKELNALASFLEMDFDAVTGMVEKLWDTEDENGDEATDKIWETNCAAFYDDVKRLREIAERIPEFILNPPRERTEA